MRSAICAAMAAAALLGANPAAAFCIQVVRHEEARGDAVAFAAGVQREARMPVGYSDACGPEVLVSFMVVEFAVIAGRAGRGFLVTYAVTDVREGDFRPEMGATWGMDRTQALLDAGRSAGAGIRARTPRE